MTQSDQNRISDDQHNNAPAAPQGEPVKFLANGTRFKMSFFDDGDSSDDTFVKCFNNFRGELDGRWVALVPAEDDCHRKLIAATTAPAPAVPDGYALISVQALQAWGKLDEVKAACVYPKSAQAPAPAQEPVDMVPRAALHEVERERDWYKTRAQTMHEHQNGQVWYWQGDGEDHPETLVNSLPVVIRADQLRELIAKPAQEVATLSLSAEDVHAAFTKNFPKTRISQAWISFAADIVQAIAARAAKPAQEVTLTDEEIFKCVQAACLDGSCPDFETFTKQELEDPVVTDFARAIISALRAKGGKL